MTRTIAKIYRVLLPAVGCLALLLAVATPLAHAATVVAGSATITSPNSTTTIINQTSKKVIINWQDFSIPAGSSMIFDQPNSKSIALNRVTGDSISNIFGSLLANGQVWIINPNGILFGKGSQVNVAALIATTSDISNRDFLDGKYDFNGTPANPNASVVNQGSINASNGGTVVLAGANVSNQGLVEADLGSVVLAGATTYSLDFNGDNLIRFTVGAPANSTGQPTQSLVSNAGKIVAQGGEVLLTAHAAKNVVDNVVNNSGVIEATSVSNKDGVIVLDAGAGGTVNDSGTLDASGKSAGQTGGSVTLTGGAVSVADGAKIDVSGDAGGGNVNIGGNAHGNGPLLNADTTTVGQATITADAITSGNGGNIVVWSNGTTNFNGSISARGGAQGGNGGFVETSGHYLGVGSAARVDTLAANGATGNWLLDPDIINIVTGGGAGVGCATSTCSIAPGTIITALSTSNVTLQATSQINVQDALTYNSANTLNLLSEGNINVDADIQNAGSGAINLVAGWDGTTTNPASFGNAGVFGNNDGSVFIGQNNDPAVGGASGATSIYGFDLTIDGSSGGAQLGYHGTGGGNIFVDLTGDLTLIGGSSLSDYAHIGNGDFTGNNLAGSGSNNSIGNVTGNISLLIDGILYTLGGNGSTLENTWIGNVAGAGHIESGNVTIIAQDNQDNCESNCGQFFGDMIQADLGATGSPGSGGDFTIAFTSPDGDSENNNSGPAFKINHGGTYDSPHALSILADVSFEVTGSFQNQGTGALTMIAGWNPAAAGVTPMDIINAVNTSGGASLANLFVTTPGAYGNNNSRILFGGDNAGCDQNNCIGDTAFGSKGGTTTVAAADVYVVAQNGYAVIGYVGSGATGDINVYANGTYSTPVGGVASCLNNSGDVCVASGNTAGYFAQIGDVGTGSSSNINVHATGDVIMAGSGLTCCDQNDNPTGIGSTEGVYAQIGNTDTAGSGADTVSGDISVVAGGVLDLETNTDASSVWIGNRSISGTGKENGDVTVIAKSEMDNGNVNVGDIVAADLGTTAVSGSGGNVTIGFTAPNDHNSGVMDIDNGAAYDSPNDLTLLSGTSILVSGSLQNTGTGGITLVTGWSPSAVTASQLAAATGISGSAIVSLFTGTANSYGQNNGSVTIGGAGAAGNSAVGSAGGTTTVLTDNLTIEADNGNAQLGYNADAGGTINVFALGDVTLDAATPGLSAQIGSGGAGSTGDNSTNINVTAGGLVSLIATGDGSAAQIGNGGLGSHGNQSGNIAVSAANLTMQATGSNANAQIGNGGSFSFGNATGNITVTIQHAINMSATTGTYGAAEIGNGGLFSNEGAIAGLSDTGTVMVSATDIDMEGTGNSSNVSIGNGGSDAGKNATSSASLLFGGNVTVTATHSLTMNSAGVNAAVWIGNGGPVSASGATLAAGSITDTGDITVTAGTSTTPGVLLLEAPGTGADVQIGNGGFFGANSATAPGGIFESGTIDVEVLGGTTHAGTATLNASGSDSLVQVGNGNPGQATGTASGNITFNVDGSITVDANPDPAMAIIGNLITSTGTLGGNVTITAITADGIGDSLVNDIQGGDVSAIFSGNDTITIDTDVAYNSSHTFSLTNGGDIVFEASLQNAGSGAINITSSGDVTIGGQNAIGNVAVGSAGGTTTIHAVNLIIEADNGYAQLGFNGDASGSIDVQLTGNLTMTGGATNTTGFFAQIGNGGLSSTGSNSGDITINADGTVTLNGGGGSQSYVQVGNGGAQSNTGATTNFSETGDIDITATSVALNGGTGTQSYVQIGNGGYMAGANMGNVNATNSGDISVTATAGTVSLSSGAGSDAYTQIGNGGDQVNANAAAGASGTNSGDVTVTSQGNSPAVTLAGGAGTNSYAQIGNGGYANNAPTTAPASNFTDTGIVTVTDLSLTGGSGSNSYAQIGLGDASQAGVADVAGQIIIAAGGSITLTNGNSAGAPAFIGCATGTGVVTCNTQPPSLTINASNIGLLASLIAAPVSSSVSPGGQNTSTSNSGGTVTTGTGVTGPIADMTNQSGGSGESTASDTAAGELGKSLDPNAKPQVQSTTVSLLGGMLRESALGANSRTPHGVPPADQDFSSWGNEGFWQ